MKIYDIANIPNELILLAYYPVAFDFKIPQFNEDKSENPEFYSTLRSITNPNFVVFSVNGVKNIQQNFDSSFVRTIRLSDPNERKERISRLTANRDNQLEQIHHLEEVRDEFCKALERLTEEDIEKFNQGQPIIQKADFKYNGNFYASQIMLATKNNVFSVFSEKNKEPKISVVYMESDKQKVDTTLSRFLTPAEKGTSTGKKGN